MIISKSPVFIGGEGRSGTTLLSVILNSHPDIAFGPELHFRGPKNLSQYILDGLECIANREIDEVFMTEVRGQEIHQAINFIKRCHRFGIVPDVLKTIVTRCQKDMKDGVAFDERCILINELGNHVRAVEGKQRWGIKIMRDLVLMDQYVGNWPNCFFIHIIRDGRDVAASQLVDHQGWGYSDIEQAANQWKTFILNVRNKSDSKRYIEVRYEDLVLDTENCLKSLFSVIDLAWDDDVMKYYEKPHSLLKNSYDHPSAKGVSQPMRTNAIGRYKDDLNLALIHEYDHIAGDVLSDLGYEVEKIGKSFD